VLIRPSRWTGIRVSALAQQTARVMLNIMSVTLINPFEVPPGREEDAVAYWDRCADVLRRQPGFIWVRLHRAILPGARFALVNVAEWESAEHFQTAVSTSDFQSCGHTGSLRLPPFPRDVRHRADGPLKKVSPLG
jgi:heme oxygenase (mycobilin-producing)